MKVVIDTNVVISSVLSPRGSPARILQKWDDGAFAILVSQPILDEYRTVLGYKRIRRVHKWNDEEIEDFAMRLASFAELVLTNGTLHVVESDPDDDIFLECAQLGGADYIVTGDDHLLSLHTYQAIQILTPANFLVLLQS